MKQDQHESGTEGAADSSGEGDNVRDVEHEEKQQDDDETDNPKNQES